MEWYYISLIVMGYLLMECFAGYVISCVWEEEDFAPLLGIFWPAFLPFLLPVWVVKMIRSKQEKERKKQWQKNEALLKNQIG